MLTYSSLLPSWMGRRKNVVAGVRLEAMKAVTLLESSGLRSHEIVKFDPSKMRLICLKSKFTSQISAAIDITKSTICHLVQSLLHD